MNDTYPVPAHCATIWVAGDQIMLALPSTIADKGHVVPFPATEKGMLAVLALMTGRSKTSFNMLGGKTALPKAEMERTLQSDAKFNTWLREMGVAKAKATDEAKAAEAFLAELDL